MSYICYIIFSKTLNRYYVGYTSDFKERLELHNNGNFGTKSYTSKANDWELFLKISCEDINQALYVEAKIKRMKSRKYIENLKKYPEIIQKILDKICTENPCAPSR